MAKKRRQPLKLEAGPAAAAKMLDGLDPQAQKKIMAYIEGKDPAAAQAIREERVTLEDLRYLSSEGLRKLLTLLPEGDLPLALRLGSKELQNHLLGLLSQGLRRDYEEVLTGRPRPLDQVQAALGRVMAIVRQQVEQGLLVLREQNDLTE